MYNRVRLTPEQRRAEILDAAVAEAMEHGLYNFSIANVSRRLKNCSRSLIKSYFRSVSGIRCEVIKYAIHNDFAKIVAQAIVSDDDAVAHLTPDNKKEWLEGAI